jgi:ketosteroid isomerase-like protein
MEPMIRQYIAAYNAQDVPGMVTLLHELVVFENVSNSGSPDRTGITATQGRAAFEVLARQSLGVFRVRQQTVRSMTLGDRTAAVEIEFTAVLAVDLPNGPKAGETLELRGVSVFGFTDGQIVRISDYS